MGPQHHKVNCGLSSFFLPYLSWGHKQGKIGQEIKKRTSVKHKTFFFFFIFQLVNVSCEKRRKNVKSGFFFAEVDNVKIKRKLIWKSFISGEKNVFLSQHLALYKLTGNIGGGGLFILQFFLFILGMFWLFKNCNKRLFHPLFMNLPHLSPYNFTSLWIEERMFNYFPRLFNVCKGCLEVWMKRE